MSDTATLDAPPPSAPAAPPSPPSQPPSAPASAPSGSAVKEPYYRDLFQADGGLNKAALDRLPEHLKGVRPLIEKYKDIDGVFKGFEQANLLASKKALAPVLPGSPPEVLAERKALLDGMNGVPKDPKEYGISRPQDIPEQQWNQKLADGFAEWAHKNSVSPASVKELLGVQMGAVKEQLAAQAQYEQQFWAKEAQAFDAVVNRENIGSERAAALVEKGARALGWDLENEQVKTFMKGHLAREAAMRHAIAIGEDKASGGAPSSGAGGADPKAEAMDIQRNPANPEYAIYRNVDQKFSRAQQEAVVAKVNRLYAAAAAKEGRQDKGRR